VSAAPLRCGIDLVNVARLKAAIEENPRFEEAVFTEGERAYCRRRADPFPHFAARFAAKEATLKALGRGISSEGPDAALLEVEVVRGEGAPRLRLFGRVLRLSERLGPYEPALSLSHEGDLAVASVVLSRRA
jgi:holo-[acyl-carrier protein] synthase